MITYIWSSLDEVADITSTQKDTICMTQCVERHDSMSRQELIVAVYNTDSGHPASQGGCA